MSKVTRIINSRTGEELVLGGEGGGSVITDKVLDTTSTNPIANKAVAQKFEEVEQSIANIGGSDTTIGEDFTTNMEVGGIASGTSISATDDLKTIIKNMLLKLKEAFVKSNPSASISPTGGNVEYGTTVSSTFTANFVDGKFTQYTNGGTSTKDIDMGCTKTATTFQKKVGNGSYEAYNGASFKVNETTYIKAIVSHSASSSKPTNSDGNSTLTYAAGSKEATATYTPYLGYFFKTSDTELAATRASFGTPTLLTGNSTTTTKAFDKEYVYVAVPIAYKVASAVSANNEPQGYETMTNTTIADAGGTMQSYNVYMYKYDAALDVNVTISITKA